MCLCVLIFFKPWLHLPLGLCTVLTSGTNSPADHPLVHSSVWSLRDLVVQVYGLPDAAERVLASLGSKSAGMMTPTTDAGFASPWAGGDWWGEKMNEPRTSLHC